MITLNGDPDLVLLSGARTEQHMVAGEKNEAAVVATKCETTQCAEDSFRVRDCGTYVKTTDVWRSKVISHVGIPDFLH